MAASEPISYAVFCLERKKIVCDSPDPPDAAGIGDPPPEPRSRFRGLTTGIVGFAAQTVVLTAVLFYFGWARARASYAYFGVDVSVLNFSVSDYVLRSVNSVFPILMAIGFVALGAVIVDRQ